MNDQTLGLTGAGTRPFGLGATRRTSVSRVTHFLFLCFLVALTTGLKSCNSETLFQSNFDATNLNQPPSPTQAVGTASTSGLPGSVLVAPAPPNASPPAKWLRIFRLNDPSQIAVFRGQLKRQPGNGMYVFSTALVIPDGNTGPASISLGTFTPSASGGDFMHLDFMPDGRVRIDDDPSTIFGTFARNQVFLVQVTLNINDTSAKARIVLSGAGASGQADRAIHPAFLPRAKQFGSVRIWMGFPHVGMFHAANVVVSRKS